MSRILHGLAAALVAVGASAPAAPASAMSMECRPVFEVVDAGLIRLALEGNGGLFYEAPLDYEVESLTGEELEFCFPAGLLVLSNDGSEQDLVITRTMRLVLPAGDTQRGALPAACAALDKHAPSSGTGFRLGGMADARLVRVAEAIERNGANGTLGAQLAVWAITDDLTMGDLTADGGGDTGGLIEAIMPILCLMGGEIERGQAILEDADVGVMLVEGGPDSATQICAGRGLPTDPEALGRQVGEIGGVALLALCCGTGVCGAAAVAVVVLVIVLLRRRRA